VKGNNFKVTYTAPFLSAAIKEGELVLPIVHGSV
jgi:hypothetical protein